jgi:hypothetical protein
MTQTGGAAPGESVMAGDGYYTAHSEPQRSAAAPGLPLLARAAAEVPLDGRDRAVIGDFGCAGGHNEMEPLRAAIGAVRARSPEIPVAVVHTDLPSNDFASLFATLDGDDSYLVGHTEVYPTVVGRSLYGPLVPADTFVLGWTAITVHWLSDMPTVVPDGVYPNLVHGPGADALREQSRRDWRAFLEHRARELVVGGQVVVVGGASDEEGLSHAEGLFEIIDDALRALVDAQHLRRSEYERIFYPTWNRTPAEFLAPFHDGTFAGRLQLHEAEASHVDDADSYPQWARDGDARAFAAAYTPFVRAVTEPSFFRWLEADRSAAEREALVEDFYRDLEARIAQEPARATCQWHTFTLRFERVG